MELALSGFVEPHVYGEVSIGSRCVAAEPRHSSSQITDQYKTDEVASATERQRLDHGRLAVRFTNQHITSK